MAARGPSLQALTRLQYAGLRVSGWTGRVGHSGGTIQDMQRLRQKCVRTGSSLFLFRVTRWSKGYELVFAHSQMLFPTDLCANCSGRNSVVLDVQWAYLDGSSGMTICFMPSPLCDNVGQAKLASHIFFARIA